VSNVLAIAAVTATLRAILLAQVPQLDDNLSDLEVTAQPPDLARKGISKAQLNVFLYQVAYNAAWRNLDIPPARAGENAPAGLALTLHYMLTAWGRGDSDNDAVNHRALAGAMSVLGDFPLLSPDDIRNALPDSTLADQVERVRVTPQAFTVEEISKLWMVYQTPYRISTLYEVSVLLIDSQRPPRTALPVLRRGAQDRGALIHSSTAPVLEQLQLPRSQPLARLGDDLTLRGRQLSTIDTRVRIRGVRLDAPLTLTPRAGSVAGTLAVHLPATAEDAAAMGNWAAGFYTLELDVQPAGEPLLASNALPFGLAPAIALGAVAASAGTAFTLSLNCVPRIRDGQQVLLIVADLCLPPQSVTNPADTTQPTALSFAVPALAAGIYTVRLRVDGADSIPVDFSGALPAFDPAQQVTVT
jgi:hypothetical protein